MSEKTSQSDNRVILHCTVAPHFIKTDLKYKFETQPYAMQF